MICDDCDLETGTKGNHATDAECMAALTAENVRLKDAIAKIVKDRKDETCAYCNQLKPELMLCCHECYMET